MSNIEPEAVEAYQAHLKTEHEMTALALFAGGFTAGRAAAAPGAGPATEEMLAWARGLIEEVRDGCGPVAGVRVFGKVKVFVRVTDVP